MKKFFKSAYNTMAITAAMLLYSGVLLGGVYVLTAVFMYFIGA